MKLIYNALLGLVFSSSVFAGPLTVDQKLQDFATLNSVIESGYGPLPYKLSQKVVDLQVVRGEFESRIRQTKSNAEYYYLVVEYIARFHDGHFGASLSNTMRSDIPIFTNLIGGKVLISESINRGLLPMAVFPFDKGDEILAIDGVPVQTVIDKLTAYIGIGFNLSERTIGSWTLFHRRGARMPLGTGTVKVKVRSFAGRESEVALPWTQSGEQFDDESMQVLSFPSRNALTANLDEFSLSNVLATAGKPVIDRTYMCNPISRIARPEGAVSVMDEPFTAYYYSTAKGNVGYVRIPDYSPENFELRYNQYEYAISKLEDNTVGLIIDQDHNCGGSVSYLERIVGLFMDKPYQPMQFTLRADKEAYLAFKTDADAIPHTIDGELFQNVVTALGDAFKKGDWFTKPIGISGIPLMYPNRIHYTKPIVMLIDHLSGSGGDAFPSMLKGYGRATLLGTRTMGAGGHVQSQPPLPFSRITFSMTRSLFYRPDGVPVEGNGAVPDINYSLTRDDLMTSNKPYREFYTQALLSLIPNKP